MHNLTRHAAVGVVATMLLLAIDCAPRAPQPPAASATDTASITNGASQPNIIFVLTDDLSWTQWDVAGNGYPEFHYQLNQNGVVNTYGNQPADYLTDVLSGLATDFVSAARKGPFVLEVATFAPHAPYTPAPRYVGKFNVTIPRVPSFNTANTNPPEWLATHTTLS